ncbi:regulator of ribonuclease activity A [Alteribacillus persepolensis]|uniref:4-hydroxy-4-methyl-2-oxoglutarate aldolase n=1 Tax=Alteribacillus persepolensis TaxID=568899 RepID=A0A1G7Y807_9BACI|nr:ribonuclease E activity regulator RraA [Alteribacillus persepolensis]SDG92581.1 regulator of ribonuclease activity A [Alteribacillus persepolensis]
MGVTADICDVHKDSVRLADNVFYVFGQKKSFSGPIHTVRVFEDNVLVKKALETIPEGSVLVVDGGGSKRCALMGDNLAAIAEKRNLAGVIINGCIRDSGEINEMPVGIFALGTNPFKSVKKGEGQNDIPLLFANAAWKPGEWVYADEDGILLAEKKLDE